MSEYFTIESDRLRIIKGEGLNNSVLTKRIVNEVFETMDTATKRGITVSSAMLSQILHKSYFIEIGGDIRSIDTEAFNLNDSIVKVRIADPGEFPFVFQIGERAFNICSHIETLEIDLSHTLVNIYEGAFQYCTNLTKVDLSCMHVQLETYAFAYCNSLKTIRLPSVGISDSDIFAHCKSLDSIYIPAKDIGFHKELATINSRTNAKVIVYNENFEYLWNDGTNASELQNIEVPETTSIITTQTSKSTIKSYNGVIRPNVIANKKNNKS